MATATTIQFDDEQIRRARSREGVGASASGVDLDEGIVSRILPEVRHHLLILLAGFQ